MKTEDSVSLSVLMVVMESAANPTPKHNLSEILFLPEPTIPEGLLKGRQKFYQLQMANGSFLSGNVS